MKNLHILPTPNASRLFYANKGQELNLGGYPRRNYSTGHCVYITNDEYIGLSYYLDGDTVRKGVVDDAEYWAVRKDYKKIIMTDDVKLVKDGVQEVSSKFLEWLIENPSCEEVKIDHEKVLWEDGRITHHTYRIITPDEEPQDFLGRTTFDLLKQEAIAEEMFELEQELGIPSNLRWHNSTPKQDSLEEAVAKKLYPYNDGFQIKDIDISEELQVAFLNGTKWEREQNSLTPSDLIEFSKWINKMGYAHRLNIIPDDLIDFYLKNKENIAKLNLE
jgi:hypothetical protein